MTKEELETYKQKLWCNLQDFMKIAQCGRNNALESMKAIREKLKEENYISPSVKVVPMKKVFEYLGIGE